MQEGRPSRTAQFAAAMRALHLLVDDDPAVFVDPLAATLVDSDAARMLRAVWDGIVAEEITRVRGVCVARQRFAEDALADAVARGVDQYVVLGAGLDSFAFRRPAHMRALRVFEVDHPGTQQWKSQRLSALGIAIPEQLTFVPVDFRSDALFPELRAAGLSPDRPAFFSWLGVTPYLTPEDVLETLRAVGRGSAPGSGIAFDMVLEPAALGEEARAHLAAIMQRVAARGEPFLGLFRPQALIERLRDAGYETITHLGPQDIEHRYFRDRADGLRPPAYYGLIEATIGR